jgi:hypothetical protein
LLVDVDGVLNPEFTAKERRRKCYHDGWLARSGYQEGRRFPLFLNPAHGPALWALAEQTGAELAWATTWNDNANAWVGPVLGLPTLPVAPAKRWSKAETVVPWTEGRPFVWLDDEPYVVEDCARFAIWQPHLVVPVNPRVGLTSGDLGAARAWLKGTEQAA